MNKKIKFRYLNIIISLLVLIFIIAIMFIIIIDVGKREQQKIVDNRMFKNLCLNNNFIFIDKNNECYSITNYSIISYYYLEKKGDEYFLRREK